MRIALTAEDGLDALGTHSPAVIQIALDGSLVDEQLAQSLQRALDCNHHVTHRHTYVTQDGRVGQVALQTRYRQLVRQVSQNGVRNTQITFRVLEINRVHLMRHCTRTYFASLDLLLEVLHRDIHPEVAVQVNHNGVDTRHRIEHTAQMVVVRNLRRPLLALQSQLLADKPVAECLPVNLGIGHMMRIVVACRPTELSRQLTSLQRLQLLRQTIHIHHHLLTQTGRRCRLSVRLCQHRNVLPCIRILLQLRNQFLYHRIVDLLERFLDGKRHARIVDVLARQAKVDELLEARQTSHASLASLTSSTSLARPTCHLINLLLDEILHGLHVVVRHLLDVLHALCISLGEVLIDGTQFRCHTLYIKQLEERGQGNEILNLYPHTVSDQGILREIRSKAVGLSPVSAVDRRHCC